MTDRPKGGDVNTVELLTKLRAEHAVELLWHDRAGPVWSSPPPAEALPWIERLDEQLAYAVRGAATGYVWAQCERCAMDQMSPLSELRGGKRSCHMTPHCPGKVTQWVELSPTVAEAWKTLKLARQVAVEKSKPRLKLKRGEG